MSTATLPRGWRERLVVMQSPSTAPGRGNCLEPHDCVVSKLVAGRDKDYAFAAALLAEGIVDRLVLEERVKMLEGVHDLVIERIRQWLSTLR